MWKSILGRSDRPAQSDSEPDESRKPDLSATSRQSDSMESPKSKPQKPRSSDRGFEPTSTTYSSSRRSQYPGTTSASVASTYVTADTHNPTSGSLEDTQLSGSKRRDTDGRRKTKTESSDRGEERRQDSDQSSSTRERRRRRKERKRTEPGQASEKRRDKRRDSDKTRSVTGDVGQAPSRFQPDSHVQSQFPGEFPSTFTEPYRPPGEAAAYYGDHGESVASQPGVRPTAPSIIVGAAPHLHEPTVQANPPVEPSSMGQVGEAASFFTSTNDGSAVQGSQGQRPPRPGKSSKPSNSSTSHPNGQYQQAYAPPSSSAPSYGAAAAAAGVAAGAAYAMHQNTQSSAYKPSAPGGQTMFATPTKHRHRHSGPLDQLVNFIKDPDGVAEYEAYTEYIGVCRDCFEPGSSPRDAPRKHHHHGRRSSAGRYGSADRIDKANRYHSSDEERRRRSGKGKSWLAAGAAGYGLAKVGEALANNKNDFDDTYSVKSGRPIRPGDQNYPYDGPSRTEVRDDSDRKQSRRRHDYDGRVKLQSNEESSIPQGSSGTTRSSKQKRRQTHDAALGSYVDLSRTESKDNNNTLETFFSSPTANRTKSGKRKNKGFFTFNNASSSSSDADLAFGSGYVKRQGIKREKSRRREEDVDAAILGLGATAAALAAAGSRDRRKDKRHTEVYATKEARHKEKGSRSRHSQHDRDEVANDDGWEDASDDDASSLNSGLAYGITRRSSHGSLSSGDSGTDKWAWRWKDRSNNKAHRKSSEAEVAAMAGGAAALGTVISQANRAERRTVSQPMQHVVPMPTSDPNLFETVRYDSRDSPVVTGTGPIPLQQPQPIVPVSRNIYAEHPPSVSTSQAPLPDHIFTNGSFTESPTQMNAKPAREVEGYDDRPSRSRKDKKERRRRDTSPAALSTGIVASSLSQSASPSVKFDLPTESRRQAREDDRKERRSKDEGREKRSRRKSDPRYEDRNAESRPRRETDETWTQEEDLDREMRRLELEHAEAEQKRKSDVSWVGPAAAGAVVAAVIAEAKPRKFEEQEDAPVGERKKERKSRRSREEEIRSEDRSPVRSDSLQRRLAKMAAERIKTSPSPSHEDYATYFVPVEIRERVKDSQGSAVPVVEAVPHFVDVTPAPIKFSFPEDLYRPFGLDPDDDPTIFPWVIPLLRLQDPTPVPSAAGSIRGDISPVTEPQSKEADEVSDNEPSRVAPVPRSQDESDEYTVSTPKEQRKDIVDVRDEARYDSPPSDASKRTRERRRQRKMREKGLEEDGQVKTRGETQPTDVHGNYGNDLEFAAALAAGAASAGFDPNIVIDEPSYHRRDSPPGTDESKSYRTPVEVSGKSREERKQPKIGEPSLQGDFNVFDSYENTSSITDGGVALASTADRTPGLVSSGDREKGQLREGAVQTGTRDTELEGSVRDSVQVDPSDFVGTDQVPNQGRTSGQGIDTFYNVVQEAASKPFALDEEPPLTGKAKKKKKKSKRSSDYFDDAGQLNEEDAAARAEPLGRTSKGKTWVDSETFDDDAISATASAPGVDEFGGRKKSKRRSQRDSEAFDDATSAVSAPVSRKEEDPAPKEKSKGNKSGGLFGGFFGAVKAAQEAAEDKGARVVEEHSQLSETQDVDDDSVTSTQRQKRTRDYKRGDEPIEDDKVEANGEPLKAERPEMPASTEGVSGPETPLSPSLPLQQQSAIATPTAETQRSLRSRSVSPQSNVRPEDFDQLGSGGRLAQMRQRRLSEIRTGDFENSHMTAISPTAVPLHFRRPPPSPVHSRSGSTNDLNATSPSIVSPLSVPRTRKERPRSGEFKSSREIRPLFLLERHASGKAEPEIEESYPALPSSRESSANPSLEDLTAIAQDPTAHETIPARTHSVSVDEGQSYWARNRATSPNYLDSQQATPTAADFSSSVKKEKPKYEFHSPSELLEDLKRHEEGVSEAMSPMQLAQPMYTESVPDLSAEEALGRGVPLDTAEPPSAVHGEEHLPSTETETVVGEAPVGAATASALDEPHEKSDFNSVPLSQDQTTTAPAEEIEASDDLVPSRTSSKKSKKDKKKKRRSVTFEDEIMTSEQPMQTAAEMETTEQTPPKLDDSTLETLDDHDPMLDVHVSGRKDVSVDDGPGQPNAEAEDKGLPVEVTSHVQHQDLGPLQSETQVVDEDEWALPTKKSKKEKRKKSKVKLDISPTKKEEQGPEPDFEAPAPSFSDARESEPFGAAEKLSTPVMKDSSLVSDEPEAMRQSTDATTSVLEEAFAKAKDARGLSSSASGDASEFMPTLSSAQQSGQADPVVQQQSHETAFPVGLPAEEPEPEDIWEMPSKSKSKKGKKSKKAEKVKLAFDDPRESPEGVVSEPYPTRESTEHLSTEAQPASQDPSGNIEDRPAVDTRQVTEEPEHFTSESVDPAFVPENAHETANETDLADEKVADLTLTEPILGSKEDQDRAFEASNQSVEDKVESGLGADRETPQNASEEPEEFSWTPKRTKSKKEKRKGKSQNRAEDAALTSDEVAAPITDLQQDNATQQGIEVVDWAPITSKKGKKAKRRGTAFDDLADEPRSSATSTEAPLEPQPTLESATEEQSVTREEQHADIPGEGREQTDFTTRDMDEATTEAVSSAAPAVLEKHSEDISGPEHATLEATEQEPVLVQSPENLTEDTHGLGHAIVEAPEREPTLENVQSPSHEEPRDMDEHYFGPDTEKPKMSAETRQDDSQGPQIERSHEEPRAQDETGAEMQGRDYQAEQQLEQPYEELPPTVVNDAPSVAINEPEFSIPGAFDTGRDREDTVAATEITDSPPLASEETTGQFSKDLHPETIAEGSKDIGEPLTEAVANKTEQPEEFAWTTPVKKTKDKKKKKGKQLVDWEDITQEAKPLESDSANPLGDVDNQTGKAPKIQPAVEQEEQLPPSAVLEGCVHVPEPETAQEDEWAIPSKSKFKKDKKKKKRATFDFLEEPSASDSIGPDSQVDPTVEESSKVEEAQVERQLPEALNESSVGQPVVSQSWTDVTKEPATPDVEDEWALPSRSKSKKKDKKKQKQAVDVQSPAAFEEPQVPLVTDQGEHHQEVPEQDWPADPVQSAEVHEPIMPPASVDEPIEPVRDVADVVATSTEIGPEPGSESFQDEWAMPKQSKSKKKKKRQSTALDWFETTPTTEPQISEPQTSGIHSNDQVASESVPRDVQVEESLAGRDAVPEGGFVEPLPTEFQEENLPKATLASETVDDEWATPTRTKSKKDKKKKKKLTLSDFGNVEEEISPDVPTTVPVPMADDLKDNPVGEEPATLDKSSLPEQKFSQLLPDEGVTSLNAPEESRGEEQDTEDSRGADFDLAEDMKTAADVTVEPDADRSIEKVSSVTQFGDREEGNYAQPDTVPQPVDRSVLHESGFDEPSPLPSTIPGSWSFDNIQNASEHAAQEPEVSEVSRELEHPTDKVTQAPNEDEPPAVLSRRESKSKKKSKKKRQTLAAWEEENSTSSSERMKDVEEPFGRGDLEAAAVAAAAAIGTRNIDTDAEEQRQPPPGSNIQVPVDESPGIGSHRSIFGPFDEKQDDDIAGSKSDHQGHRDNEIYRPSEPSTFTAPEISEPVPQDNDRAEDVKELLQGDTQTNRDSAVHLNDSPLIGHESFHDNVRDSGYVPSPIMATASTMEVPREKFLTAQRPLRPLSPTSSAEDVRVRTSSQSHGEQDRDITSHPRISEPADRNDTAEAPRDQPASHHTRFGHVSPTTFDDYEEDPIRTFTPERVVRQPSPIDSTSKDRSSNLLFGSSPSNRAGAYEFPEHEAQSLHRAPSGLHRTTSIHGHRGSHEDSLHRAYREHSPARDMTPPLHARIPHQGARDSHEWSVSPPKTPLEPIHESDHRSSESLSRDRAAKSPNKSQPPVITARSRRNPPEPIEASSSTHDSALDKGKGRARDMAGVYDGWGEAPGSPLSPTRPPSVRQRRSMQHIQDLEQRLDQLASENRLLASAKITAEKHLEDIHFAQSKNENASQEAIQVREVQLREKDADIERLKETLEHLQNEVVRLSQVNEGLTSANLTLARQHEERVNELEAERTTTRGQWEESTRELEDLRGQHNQLSSGMEQIVRHEIDTALMEKNLEIERLHSDLESAKAKIRELQQQLLDSQSRSLSGGDDDIIAYKDEDYFETACQNLCQHVKQWILRFSKFSDTRVCRLISEIRDEKIVDRFDNAILDGSEVDTYLSNRTQRRDVFMSVVMTMIFEYIFSRYLFGMDREQRQKLKQLEKSLLEIGPPSAVNRWRALTLTILSKRPQFQTQKASDTEAVAHEIFATLSKFLPPPQHLEHQILASLTSVLRLAVDLSIEMRTQRAEYIMLPPLQPEYDVNGDLARKVYFNASLMNERSGEFASNEDLEDDNAVVRMVLFPLVVKKEYIRTSSSPSSPSSSTRNEDEHEERTGDRRQTEREDEVVVCPAQVLVATPATARPSSTAAAAAAARKTVGMTADNRSFSARSDGAVSSVPTTATMYAPPSSSDAAAAMAAANNMI